MIRAILFLAALTAYAQTYEVRGTVTEVGAGGILDVEITIQRIEDGASKKTKSDGQGAFRVTVDAPGAYIAIAAKDGYTGTGPLGAILAIDPARPQTVVNVTLTRMGEVSGRVLDEETREPVSGVEITLFTKQWRFGQLSLNSDSRKLVRTDTEGRFRVTGLAPGTYIASVRPRLSSVLKLESFTNADADKIDEDYPATYWPGGGDAASSYGATLTSGGYADVGTIFVRKIPQYRVRVTVQGGCPEDGTIDLYLLRRNGGSAIDLGEFACSGEVLLRGFDPGSYMFYASSERRSGVIAGLVSGFASVEVVDKNLRVAMALQRNIVIEGQLTVADGATAPRLIPRITASPFDLMPGAQLTGTESILWAPDQRHFQLAVSPRAQTLLVSDPIGGYVKEIRYNGTPLRGSTLPINPGVASHKLEIVVDDKWGSLAGSVTDGSRGVPAAVMILKDAARVDDLARVGTLARAVGPDGSIPAAQFAPGDYRIVAVAPAQAQRIHEPGVLERMLGTAQRVTVSPGSAQTVAVRVGDVR